MGSGFVANSYVFSLVKDSKTLEKLGTDFLIKIFGSDEWEDFETHDLKTAHIIRNLVFQNLDSPDKKSDVIPINGMYKVAFFK